MVSQAMSAQELGLQRRSIVPMIGIMKDCAEVPAHAL